MEVKINIRKMAVDLSVLGLFLPTLLSSLTSVIFPTVAIYNFVILFSVFLFFISNKKYTRKTPHMTLLGLCFLIIVITIGFIRYDVYIGTFLIYILTLLFCISSQNSEDWIKPLIKYNIFFGVFYILMTFLMRVNSNLYYNLVPNLYTYETRFGFWYEQGYMTGITDHNSTNGMVLANVFIFISGIYFAKKDIKRKTFLPFLIMTLAVIAIFMTGKRAHLLFSILAVLLTYYIYGKNEKNHQSKYILIVVAMGVILFLLYLFVPQVQAVVSRFSDISEDENILIRLEFWKNSLIAFKENTLLGIGWFGFINSIAPQLGYTGNSHNVYIQVLCETGLIGAIFIYGWMILALVSTIRYVQRMVKDKFGHTLWQRTIMFVSLSYQLYFIMYCVTGNPLYDVYTYQLYFVLSSYSITKSQNLMFSNKTNNLKEKNI